MKGVRLLWFAALLSVFASSPAISSENDVFTVVKKWLIMQSEPFCYALTKQRDEAFLFAFRENDIVLFSDAPSLPDDESLVGKAAILRPGGGDKIVVGRVEGVSDQKYGIRFSSTYDFNLSFLFETDEWSVVEVAGKRYRVYTGGVTSALDAVRQCNKFHGF